MLPSSVEDGARIAYEIPPASEGLTHTLVGRMEAEFADDGRTPTPGRRFVKANLAASGQVLMCSHDGFAVSYSTLSPDEARENAALDAWEQQVRATNE